MYLVNCFKELLIEHFIIMAPSICKSIWVSNHGIQIVQRQHIYS